MWQSTYAPDRVMTALPDTRHRAPTILDVAAYAGVSKSTVSNVLQGKVPVSEDKRERVLSAVAELGYQPNAGARSMRQGSRTLGVVVGDLLNPFHAELVTRLAEQAAQRGHAILLGTTGATLEREMDQVAMLLQHRVAAIIFTHEPRKESLALIGDDVRFLLASVSAKRMRYFATDQLAGLTLAVRHLQELGHSDIGYVGARVSEPEYDHAHFRAYQQAMQSCGLSVKPSNDLRPIDMHDSDHDADLQPRLRAFLASADRPSAVIAATDFDALALLSVAAEVGVRIPDDLSVVGFDDIDLAGHSRIGLTTIAQPMEQIAELAVSAGIDGKVTYAGRARTSVSLIPELVVRNSTAPPA
jgi:DNA-binding LacI/PurR family transcriptional regulator